jgi:hypothetical protein
VFGGLKDKSKYINIYPTTRNNNTVPLQAVEMAQDVVD